MKKSWILGAAGVAGVAVVVSALTLGLLRRDARPPERPATVPATAEWAGRGTSGRFFLLEGRAGTIYTIRAFEAPSGAEHSVRHWRLVGFARTGLISEEIAGFEEGRILLKDGSKLLPAD